MLKISSQRLLINVSSKLYFRTKKKKISFILIYLRKFIIINLYTKNSKLIITLRIKSYLKGIFASLMFLTNEFFFIYKPSLLHLQLTFLIRYFYTFCSFAHQVLREIHPILFLDTLRQK